MYSSKEKSASRTRGLCLTTAILAAGLTSGAMAASNLALNVVDATVGANGKVVVKVAVNGDAVDAVGAQFVLEYDTTKLSLDATANGFYTFDGSALDLELFEDNNTTTGIYRLAIGADGTDAGEVENENAEVDDNILTLTFTPVVEFCELTGLVEFVSSNGFSSMLSDNTGAVALDATGATNLPEVSFDQTYPVFVGTPANQSYWADAEGAATTSHTYVSPTATDNCDANNNGEPTVTYSRSDSAANLTEWPRGSVTTITWSVTDDCGNTSTVSRTVDVSADSLVYVTAAQGGAFASANGDTFTRGISIAVSKNAASDSDIQTVTMDDAGSVETSRVEGSANFQVLGSTDWASGCAEVRDPLHTLRREFTIEALAGSGTHGGRSYNNRFAIDGNDSASEYLKVGNADGNTVIDILDFGKFVSQRGSSLSPNTTASSSGTHTDFNASGVVNNGDLSFLAVNFFSVDESCSSYTGDAPRARISVKELRRTGQGELVAADINGDGWVDTTDMALMLQGQTGQPVRTGNSSSGNVAW
jgi:hypothetical protein